MTGLRVALLCALAAACVRSSEVVCSDGRICAPGNTCDDVNHRCLSPEQVAACSGHAEGDPCTLAAVAGVCHDGICEPLVCGDGVRTGTELCDGSDLGGADCTAAGFYEPGGLACTPFCTFDTSQCAGFCGNGVVDGPELCDGAPPAASCFDEGFDAGALQCSSACGASFVSCARFGWRPELTGVANQAGLAGISANDLWTGGKNDTDGVVGHFDGAAWTIATTVPNQSVVSVAEAAPGDVWAVASGSILLHLANGVWTSATGAPVGTYKEVFAISPSTVVVATSDAGVLEWNGAGWQTVGSLAAATSVRGTSASDLWAVQSDGTLHHWDGATWQANAPPNVLVRRVAVRSPTDVWIVGSNTLALGNVAAHWDGATWTPYVDTLAGQALAILPLADNDVWITYSGSGVARHFDGLRWTRLQGVATPGVPLASIIAVPDELVASSFNGVVYRFDGQVYTQLVADTGDVSTAQAVWSDAPDDIFTSDVSGNVMHFDGQAWTLTALAPTSVFALWGSGPSDVWAAARTSTSGLPLYHFDGTGWSNLSTFTGTVSGLLGTGLDDVWVLGTTSVIHYDGSKFTPSLAVAAQVIGASAPDDVWVATGSATVTSTLYHWNGATWSSGIAAPRHVTALAVLAANSVFATADGNHILHYDGSAWSDTQLLVFDNLLAASATAPDDIFVASPTTIFHYDGTRWSRVRAPSDAGLGGGTLGALRAHRGWIDLVYSSTTNTIQVRQMVRTKPWNCRASETNCDDGVDDDCDGKVDHLDPDCP